MRSRTKGPVGHYLRLDEAFTTAPAPTRVRPGELGTSGGAVARYLKIERPARPQKKVRPPANKASCAPKPAVLRDDAGTVVDAPTSDEQEAFTAFLVEVPRVAEEPPATVCPDCEGPIALRTTQCPHCALLLDKAA